MLINKNPFTNLPYQSEQKVHFIYIQYLESHISDLCCPGNLNGCYVETLSHDEYCFRSVEQAFADVTNPIPVELSENVISENELRKP